jgi:hypothetical protein
MQLGFLFLNTSELTILPIGSIGLEGEEFPLLGVAYVQVVQLAYAPPRTLVFSNKSIFTSSVAFSHHSAS